MFLNDLAVLMLHVECPYHLVRAINHEGEADSGADVHVLQAIDHRARAVLHQEGIYDDECEAKLRRTKLQVTNLQTVGRGKGEKRAHLVTGKKREHDQNLVAGALREDKCVTDDDRTQEQVVEEMIHVIAPSHQTRSSILPDFAVVVIGDVLQEHHGRHSPEPPQVSRGQIREVQNESRPHERQHRQMIGFQPVRDSGQNPYREPALEWGKERRVAFACTWKLLSLDHSVLEWGD